MRERKYKNDEMISIEETMDWVLGCLYTAKTDKEKEYFRAEYRRLSQRHMEAAEEWMAIL